MTQKEFEELLNKAKLLRQKKNTDYGNAFLNSYNKVYNGKIVGNTCIMYDIDRKTSRLNNILFKQLFEENQKIQVSDETIEDTLMDLSIICLNAIIAINARKN